MEASLRAAIANSGFYLAEYRIRRPNGEIGDGVSGTVSRDAHGQARRLDGVVGDVTDRAGNCGGN